VDPSLKKPRPTTTGAVLEVLLVLAVGIVAAGIWNGWLSPLGGSAGKEQHQGVSDGDTQDSKSGYEEREPVATRSSTQKTNNLR
jgi:hypothetical protein